MTEKRTSCIPEEDRHRKISCTDRETWIKKIIHAFYGDIRKNVPFSLPDIGEKLLSVRFFAGNFWGMLFEVAVSAVVSVFGVAFYVRVCYNN